MAKPRTPKSWRGARHVAPRVTRPTTPGLYRRPRRLIMAPRIRDSIVDKNEGRHTRRNLERQNLGVALVTWRHA
jgi:hypothetical protein